MSKSNMEVDLSNSTFVDCTVVVGRNVKTTIKDKSKSTPACTDEDKADRDRRFAHMNLRHMQKSVLLRAAKEGKLILVDPDGTIDGNTARHRLKLDDLILHISNARLA